VSKKVQKSKLARLNIVKKKLNFYDMEPRATSSEEEEDEDASYEAVV